jgi:hypothetical protein
MFTEHGPTAGGSAAVARILGTDIVCDLTVDAQAVVNEKLFAGANSFARVNEYAIAGFNGFAVWVARVIQESRTVPAAAAVNHAAVGKTEHECMPDLGPLTGSSASPAGYFTLVLDEPLAGGDGLQRKESFAMH